MEAAAQVVPALAALEVPAVLEDSVAEEGEAVAEEQRPVVPAVPAGMAS